MQTIILENLKKGIKTSQNRINKGLEGKKLAYALRYIKGAKTRIKKIKEAQKTNKINKKVANLVKGVFKTVINKKVANLVKGVFKTVINKKVANLVKGVFKTVIDKIEEKRKEKDFLKRWEELEDMNKWKE